MAPVIQQLDQAREKVRVGLADLDPQQEVCPGWTVKHLLAHLTGWDQISRQALQSHLHGEAPAVPTASDVDAFNDRAVAQRQQLDYAAVRREWETVREQLKATLTALPPERLNKTLVFPWGTRGTIAELGLELAHHEAYHARELATL
jgi:uncharacterized protein (TIGR03083 family)